MEVLYHTSTNKDLEVIEPQRTLSSNVYIGDYVFATSNHKLAAMYLVARGTPILLNIKTAMPHLIICANPEEYRIRDRGGAIYTIPAESFHKTPQKGLEDSGLVSEVAITPISKKVYETSIEALREEGVEIYFVSKEQFDEIVNKKNEAEIIARLTAY